ncbi:dCTP deaminase [Streptomyces sp. NPDC001307]|uniref:dCTP deaminase n=1 Tax=Streptomyces sp. NPDC001307 TaxID=3364560 RepID=UPI0036914D46
MILTGPEITAAAHDGRLRITPFAADQVNPNSYNVRLGPTLITYTSTVLDAHRPNPTRETTIGPDGHVLQPADTFVPLLFGRSSVGRLGLFVEITAPIGDIGFHGQWTLMLTPIRPLRVYASMKIGQIMFFLSTGAIDLYRGKYQAATGPQPSAYWRDLTRLRAVAS